MKFNLTRALSVFVLSVVMLVWAVAPIALTGCKTPTQQKLAVNTITSTHLAVDATLDTYLDLVISGKLATNNVPNVLEAYGTYQAAYRTALTVVLGNSNAPAPSELSHAATAFTETVNISKKGGTP